MPVTMNHVLRRDPAMLAEFRERVGRCDWGAARRLSLALGLHDLAGPSTTESTSEFFVRLADTFAPEPAHDEVRKSRGSARPCIHRH